MQSIFFIYLFNLAKNSRQGKIQIHLLQ